MEYIYKIIGSIVYFISLLLWSIVVYYIFKFIRKNSKYSYYEEFFKKEWIGWIIVFLLTTFTFIILQNVFSINWIDLVFGD